MDRGLRGYNGALLFTECNNVVIIKLGPSSRFEPV